MRALRIFGIGMIGLVMALSSGLWAKWALLIAAGLPLFFVIVGQFFFPQSKRSLRLWMNPDVLQDDGDVTVRLSGKDITLAFFKKWYEFNISVSNLWLLAAVCLTSLGAVAGAWAIHELPMPGFSPVFYTASFWVVVCYLGWRWIWERRALKQTGIALGSFRVVRQEKPFMKRVVFHFTDEQGAYHGGSFRTLFCDTRDDLTIIFYDESNPEVSVPASAMMFHRLEWA